MFFRLSMKRISFFILILLLQSCADTELPAGNRGDAFKLADPIKQASVIAELKKRNIPFEINEEGLVIYLLRNQAEVDGITRNALFGEILKDNVWESAVLINQLTRDKYESAFRTAKIPYRILEHKGTTEIVWNQLYGPQVDLLRQRLDGEISDYYYEQVLNQN